MHICHETIVVWKIHVSVKINTSFIEHVSIHYHSLGVIRLGAYVDTRYHSKHWNIFRNIKA